MADLFQIPKTRLQKAVFMKGKTLLQSIPEYIDVLGHASDTKVKLNRCGIPTSSAMGFYEAFQNTRIAHKAFSLVKKIDKERQKILQKNINVLFEDKEELLREVEKIESNHLQNLIYKENEKFEILTKVDSYINSVREIVREKQNQDILKKIGLIIETLFEDLAPYEEILGRLSLQEDAFKSKADTLAIKKNILSTRMKKLNAEFKKTVFECEELKKRVFTINFELREYRHYNMNLINKIIEIDKSMRAILDLEQKLANLRKLAYQVRVDNTKFFWFIDWVLFDVYGAHMLAGIYKHSSPQEKVQCIIDTYKKVKKVLAARKSESAPKAIDNIFN